MTDQPSFSQAALITSRSSSSNIDEEIYPCCNKPYGGKFMVCCEKCNQWLHGECVNIEQSFVDQIDKYYCKSCLSTDSTLEIVYKKKYISKIEKLKKEEEEHHSQRCEKCLQCQKANAEAAHCGTCLLCLHGEPRLCISLRCSQIPVVMKKKAGRPRKETIIKGSTSEEDTPLPLPKPALPTVDDNKPKRGRKKGWKKDQQTVVKKPEFIENKITHPENTHEFDMTIANKIYQQHSARKGRKKNDSLVKTEPKQCLGPGCIQETRLGSKYCSDACGLALAKIRLERYLPQKVKEYWEHIPSTDIRYHAMAKEKEVQVQKLHNDLKDLVEMSNMLQRYANSLAKARPNAGEEGIDENEGMAWCTVCGQETTNKQLPNHIWRCFIRSEKQTAFGSTNKDNQYEIFCNEFNKISDTYCKRLKIMCPEHYKGGIENNMEVCGCPKIWDHIKDHTPSLKEVFVSAEQLMSKRFCLAPRKECTRHHRWLQISLGIIDNERLNLLYKLNEVQEAYLTFMNAVNMHGDVITLMCTGHRASAAKDEPMEA